MKTMNCAMTVLCVCTCIYVGRFSDLESLYISLFIVYNRFVLVYIYCVLFFVLVYFCFVLCCFSAFLFCAFLY